MSDTPRSESWRTRGARFTWRPSAPGVEPVDIFHVEAGDASLPVLLLVHGFPTCSIDWFDVIEDLSEQFRVCALDFPGYGFSDKPRGWGYSLARDAELLGFYLTEVLATETATVVAHDRGDSVALIHAARCADGGCAARVERLVLTNANIFLPLSQLTTLQQLLLDASTAPRVLAQLTPEILAQGMGMATFSPPRRAADPDVEALAATFAHANGIGVLPETIQLVPGASHYLQNDRPDAFVAAVRHAVVLDAGCPAGPIASAPGAPVLVDVSRERLPSAAELLAVPPGLAEQIPA